MLQAFQDTPARRLYPNYRAAVLLFVKEQVDRFRLARIDTDDLYGVSFNPGRAIQGRDAADDADNILSRLVSEWSRQLDTRGLGINRRHLSKLKRIRPAYALVAQEGARTWHYHGVAFVPRQHVDGFEQSAMRLWGETTPGGDMHMEPLPDGRWLGYITRDIRQDQPTPFRIIPEPIERSRSAATAKDSLTFVI